MPDETHVKETSGTWDVLDFQPGTDVKETFRQKPARHFRLRTFLAPLRRADAKQNSRRGRPTSSARSSLRRSLMRCGGNADARVSSSRVCRVASSGTRAAASLRSIFSRREVRPYYLLRGGMYADRPADDRFIVKEISRLEMDALLKFAPDYFDYMSKAFFHRVSPLTRRIPC